MKTTSLYPVLISADVAASADFYRTHFGFETTFESDWYVSLRLGTWELAVLQNGHPTIPEAHRDRTADGVLLNLEVGDVDAVHARLVAAGLTPVLGLRSEDFGQRHAIFRGPDGVLIDVITPIAPSGEFVEQFSEDALAETRGAVTVSTSPERPTLLHRRTVPVADLASFQGEALGAVLDHLHASDVAPAGPPYVRYHSSGDTETDVEVGVPVDRAVAGSDAVTAATLPGGRSLTTTHLGDHSSLGESYAALAAAVTERGLTASGPAWEVYHWIDPVRPLDPAAWPAPTQWRTTLVQPVAD